ncbi:ANTAR domain-containing protein [Modestobacter sp. DSM 44400]|uniref:ANTAR domain-containing protein n=1 Tax=Modestobacter sp. DSM 44400 TaxID=1550230 RepID=UPI00089D4EB3|nr:ANTAR domain-containing protein [Modestobacter sp. DSM 44400]SDX47948.1 ANTAR domain-containing protein [Modestobacter sp. DSM 44400]
MSETVRGTSATSAPADAWPDDVVRTPDGLPAVVLVRTARGWTPLHPAEQLGDLPLVEGMTLADLVAEEAGAVPEPGRQARLAARKGPAPDAPTEVPDPRDAELAELRRTVGQLEHALAARVSIERAIGVLAERHGSSPREAFDELRRRARAQGRPAQELAREVLDGLPARAAVPGQRTTSDPAHDHRPTADTLPGPRPPTVRRVTRRPRPAASPGTGAEAHN